MKKNIKKYYLKTLFAGIVKKILVCAMFVRKRLTFMSSQNNTQKHSKSLIAFLNVLYQLAISFIIGSACKK